MEEGNSSFFGGNKMIYDKYVELKNKNDVNVKVKCH